MNNTIKHIIHFIGIILIQVLVIDQVSFGIANSFINPIILGTTLLILPIGTSTNRLLLIAFILGIILDTFHNTLGINTSALLTMAFFRPLAIRTISPREGFESFLEPTVVTVGLGKFSIYSSILFLVYHLVYFSLESLNLNNILMVLFKAFASAVIALFFSILYQYLTLKRK